MKRNTNAIFWIICGAILILTMYIAVETNFAEVLSKPFKDWRQTVDKADDNSVPEKPIFESKKQDGNNSIFYYKVSKNATRYECRAGTEKKDMRERGIVFIDKQKITCKFSSLEDGTKYFIKAVANNGSENIESSIIEFTK